MQGLAPQMPYSNCDSHRTHTSLSAVSVVAPVDADRTSISKQDQHAQPSGCQSYAVHLYLAFFISLIDVIESYHDLHLGFIEDLVFI